MQNSSINQHCCHDGKEVCRMGDIRSYIKEKGGLSFEEWAFGEVDSLILSQLSYLNFQNSGAAQKKFSDSLQEIVSAQFTEEFVSQTLTPDKNRELLFAAAESKRFGGICPGYYCNLLDAENEKQFAAVTFRLGKQFYYVAYRGTDGSFVGWKEDLNLSFSKQIPAQLDAVHYYEEVCKRRKGEFLLGGHSKGGNLAVYTAMACSPKAKKKLGAVYNHDGPGFVQEFFSQEEYQKIRPLIHKTIPQTAIVGLLLEQHEDYSVVESDAFAFLQHDPFSWVVEEGAFVPIQSVTFFSEYTNKALNTWLNQLDMETRRKFVETLYQMIVSTNANTFSELLEQGGTAMKLFFRNLRSTDPEVKKLMNQTIAALIRVSMHEMKSLLHQRIVSKKENAASETDNSASE